MMPVWGGWSPTTCINHLLRTQQKAAPPFTADHARYVSIMNRIERANMFEDDRSYFQHRAEVEIERAQQAELPRAVAVHYQLAEAYLAKLAAFTPVEADA